MNSLPDEILVFILSQLNFQDLITMEKVNKFLNTFIKSEPWPHIRVNMLQKFYNKDFVEKNKQQLKRFIANHQFAWYDFTETYIDDEFLSMIRGCKKIHLGSCQFITHRGLFELSKNNSIELIKFDFCHQITDVDLLLFKDCKSISLYGIKNITDNSLSIFTKCEMIEINGFDEITDKALTNLKKCKNIRIVGSKITDVGISHLSACETIDLVGCEHINGSSFTSLTKLRELNFLHCYQINEENIKKLKNVKINIF